MKWRKWNNIIHRDLGYLCVGLTIIYAVSGVAVNHVQDWNPNYIVEKQEKQIKPILAVDSISVKTVLDILEKLEETSSFKNYFRPDSQTVQIFLERSTIYVNLKTGRVIQETVKDRPILREMNFLHLNHPKRLWTWFADLYAISLALLAITGIFVIKGKKGLKGRGKWLILRGVLFPIIFLLFYF